MHILGYSVNGYFNIGAVLSMKAIKTGLSKKLLTRVLSVYFILTVIVTVGQIFTEYLSTKNHVEGELQTLKNTFSSSLTRALWELNTEQARSIAEGLLELPIVEGVQVRGENGNFVLITPKYSTLRFKYSNYFV